MDKQGSLKLSAESCMTLNQALYESKCLCQMYKPDTCTLEFGGWTFHITNDMDIRETEREYWKSIKE